MRHVRNFAKKYGYFQILKKLMDNADLAARMEKKRAEPKIAKTWKDEHEENLTLFRDRTYPKELIQNSFTQ